MLKGNINHKVNKHVNPKFLDSRNLIEDGVIEVRHVVTSDMAADLLTKPLAAAQHLYLTEKILGNLA